MINQWLGSQPAPGIAAAWRKILTGSAPVLSIEITRECPLDCPGCYAYGNSHLGGQFTLRELSDRRGNALVQGVLDLVRSHQPSHVSLVGGEPMVRHRELSQILPALSQMGIYTMVVTSAVIPFPQEWVGIDRLVIGVSVDGLPEHHDVRRKPATYLRLLENIAGRRVDIHWTITRPMMTRPGYLEEYVAFWSARPEVNRIWVSIYTPQIGEDTPEMLSQRQRQAVVDTLVPLQGTFPKLLMSDGIAHALLNPPRAPDECLFSQLSANFSADLASRVEPCVFGGQPDCCQCGCTISSGFHWLGNLKIAGPLKIKHLVKGSIAAGRLSNRFRLRRQPDRWALRRAEVLQTSPIRR
jgi:MoaA/NifB/PqqE/SkfB family radical SAM enzyme